MYVKRILPWLVIIALLFLAVKLTMPNFIRNHRIDPRVVCINNLRLIDSAKMQFELEAKVKPGDVVTMEMIERYLRRQLDSKKPTCPIGGTYIVNPIGVFPICSLVEQGHRLPDDVSAAAATNVIVQPK
jgi:hypothetical protein